MFKGFFCIIFSAIINFIPLYPPSFPSLIFIIAFFYKYGIILIENKFID